jgi:acyl-CoA synthetase (NDP forming)
MVGLGGIFVEVLNDVSFRLCPLKKRDAKEMLEELKGYRILQSFRGSKKVNLNKLQELLVNLSKFLLKEKNIHSVDFNPIFIDEKEINIADFRIITKENV